MPHAIAFILPEQQALWFRAHPLKELLSFAGEEFLEENKPLAPQFLLFSSGSHWVTQGKEMEI